MKRFYHFLGGVTFATLLISCAALMVAVGTYHESTTESHQAAAEMIYSSLFFKLLLIGFFLNILISALRRWPFRAKHIPFLITHLGLLMLISGTFIKTIYGVQGNVFLVEGGSSSQVQLPGSMALSITQRDNRKTATFPIEKKLFGNYKLKENSFCKLLGFCSHSEEKLLSWIVDGKAHFYGHPPFQAQKWQPDLPLLLQNPLAILTDSKKEAIQAILEEGLTLSISDTITGKKLGTLPLKEKKRHFGDWQLQAKVEDQAIHVIYESSLKKGSLRIDLSGQAALLNQHELSFLGKAPLTIDVVSNIPLTLLQDSYQKTAIMTADSHGRLYSQEFDAHTFPAYIAYNEGFDGYSVQAELLGPDKAYSRKELEKKIHLEFKELLAKQEHMAPILTLFKQACEACQYNFSKTFADFLEEWHRKGGWLYPSHISLSTKLEKIFQHFDWSSLPPKDLRSCLWLCHFFKDFDPSLLNGESFLSLLKSRKWPLMPTLELLQNDEERLSLFSEQLFSLGEELPWISFSQDPITLARIFTAFLRLYGIHYSHISLPEMPLTSTFTTVESPLKRISIPVTPLPKLESNLPQIQLQLANGEQVALTFDRFNSALKWPTQDGNHLLQFHYQSKELPYSIWLHRAKQVNYPESDQTFSYESELTFKDRRSLKEVRKVISMNEVHETWDGYRFYLSGLSKNSSGAHLVQLVVNRDPAKYWLTYPGGLLVALGILLLFWGKDRIVIKIRKNLILH